MALALALWPQAQRQRLFPIQALNALVVHHQPFAAQQQIKPWTPEASALLGQLSQSTAQTLIAVWRWDTPQRSAIEFNQLTSPPLGVAVRLDDLTRGLAGKVRVRCGYGSAVRESREVRVF